MGRMKGKVVAITGGAGGIGAAPAPRVLEEGAKVVFSDRDAEKGSAFEQQLGVAEALVVSADVSIETDAARFIDETVLRFGRVDVLVNNAAIRNYVDVTEASAESWDRMLVDKI